MLIIVPFSLTFVNDHRDQMMEQLTVEKALIYESAGKVNIAVFLRNIGHIAITLNDYAVNGKRTALGTQVILPALEGNPNAEATVLLLTNIPLSEKGVYLTSFFSSRNKELGNLEVKYL